MHTQFTLQVVLPALELLKKSAKILHFIAAATILFNAYHIWQMHSGSLLLCITQAIIGIDIIVLVFFTGDILIENPKLNVIFRLLETLVLLGISISLLLHQHYFLSFLHFISSVGFYYLLKKEIRVLKPLGVNITPTGISIPHLLKNIELSWVDVKTILPKYHSIQIETNRKKIISFDLLKNLKIDELQQINDFCTKHLING